MYFNKLVGVVLRILSSVLLVTNPFGRHRGLDFFKCIEFQNCGSLRTYTLLWLKADPQESIYEHMRLITGL